VESVSGRFLAGEVRDHFLSIAPAVEHFASEHGLRIDRYRKGKPAWELRYARRDGAVATIVLSAREPTWHALDVVAVFWLDDWATRTRRLRSEKVAVYFWRDSPQRLEEQLQDALGRLDRWSLDDLGRPHGPFKDWPAHEDDFIRALKDLPLR
jgi:hypothetical protein